MSVEIISHVLPTIITKIPVLSSSVRVYNYNTIKTVVAGFNVNPRNDISDVVDQPTHGIVYQPVTTETGANAIVARNIKQISVPYSGEDGAEILWPATAGVRADVPHHFKVHYRQDAHGSIVYDIFYEEIATGTSVRPTLQIRTIVSDGTPDSLVLPTINSGDILLGTDLVFRGNRGSKVIYDYFALYVKTP